MTKLVIGYGNTLRGDDGFGVRVAEALQNMDLTGIEVLTCHQLTPELAENLSEAQHVLFIDATTELLGGELRLQDVHPAPLPRSITHHLTPGPLLTLATQLYGNAAQAQLLTVGVVQMAHGEEWSPEVQAVLPQALEIAQKFCRESL